MYTCHGSRGKKELGTADTTSVSSSCLPTIHPCAEEFGASGTQVPSSAGVRDRVLEGVYGIRRLTSSKKFSRKATRIGAAVVSWGS